MLMKLSTLFRITVKLVKWLFIHFTVLLEYILAILGYLSLLLCPLLSHVPLVLSKHTVVCRAAQEAGA